MIELTQPKGDSQKNENEIVVDSYSERRRVRESLGQAAGENRYGGQRCRCSCGDEHWRKPETVVVQPAG